MSGSNGLKPFSVPRLSADLNVPLIVEKLEATTVQKPGTHEEKFAYKVTLIGVMPEKDVNLLMLIVKKHSILANMTEIPDETPDRDAVQEGDDGTDGDTIEDEAETNTI